MIVARLEKNILLIQGTLLEKENFVNLASDKLGVKEIVEDIVDESNAYIDNKGVLHVKEIRENQRLG